jgi:hypothetical protein
MAREVFATIGSGTLPFTRGILPAAQRGAEPTGEGARGGTQVMIGNPEDLNSVDVWAVSGVAVPDSEAVQIMGPTLNPLPRMRTIILQNVGANDVAIAPDNNANPAATNGGFILETGAAAQTITLPFLHNVEIWARADSGGGTINMIMY